VVCLVPHESWSHPESSDHNYIYIYIYIYIYRFWADPGWEVCGDHFVRSRLMYTDDRCKVHLNEVLDRDSSMGNPIYTGKLCLDLPAHMSVAVFCSSHRKGLCGFQCFQRCLKQCQGHPTTAVSSAHYGTGNVGGCMVWGRSTWLRYIRIKEDGGTCFKTVHHHPHRTHLSMQMSRRCPRPYGCHPKQLSYTGRRRFHPQVAAVARPESHLGQQWQTLAICCRSHGLNRSGASLCSRRELVMLIRCWTLPTCHKFWTTKSVIDVLQQRHQQTLAGKKFNKFHNKWKQSGRQLSNCRRNGCMGQQPQRSSRGSYMTDGRRSSMTDLWQNVCKRNLMMKFASGMWMIGERFGQRLKRNVSTKKVWKYATRVIKVTMVLMDVEEKIRCTTCRRLRRNTRPDGLAAMQPSVSTCREFQVTDNVSQSYRSKRSRNRSRFLMLMTSAEEASKFLLPVQLVHPAGLRFFQTAVLAWRPATLTWPHWEGQVVEIARHRPYGTLTDRGVQVDDFGTCPMLFEDDEVLEGVSERKACFKPSGFIGHKADQVGSKIETSFEGCIFDFSGPGFLWSMEEEGHNSWKDWMVSAGVPNLFFRSWPERAGFVGKMGCRSRSSSISRKYGRGSRRAVPNLSFGQGFGLAAIHAVDYPALDVKVPSFYLSCLTEWCCVVLNWIVLFCGGVVWCCVVLRCAALCCAVLHCVALCCVALRCVVSCRVASCRTVSFSRRVVSCCAVSAR
jgi:hypothetical protein